MAGARWTAFWKVTAVAYTIIAASTAGYVAYESTLQQTPCAPVATSSTYSSAPWSIGYATEDIEIEGNHTGAGPSTNITFRNVTFRLWPVFNGGILLYIQGAGFESRGVDLSFAVFPVNETPNSWFSVDGVFGVSDVSWTGTMVSLMLSVASAGEVSAAENVTIPAGPNFGVSGYSLAKCVDFLGNNFALQIAGEWLHASATLMNGTVVGLTLWDGSPAPLVLCSAPGFVSAGATCLYAEAFHVGLAWYGLNVTLTVPIP